MSLVRETSPPLDPQLLPVVYAKPSAVPWATPERRLVLCALATSGLLYLCYFPVAWGFLAWVALVPLIGLVRSAALPLLLTLPVPWTAVAFIQANFLGGFPWYLLGYSQHRFDTLIQVADVSGVYGLSFLLVAVNALVFEWLYRLVAVRRLIGRAGEPAPTRRPVLTFQSTVALLVFAGCLAYG